MPAFSIDVLAFLSEPLEKIGLPPIPAVPVTSLEIRAAPREDRPLFGNYEPTLGIGQVDNFADVTVT